MTHSMRKFQRGITIEGFAIIAFLLILASIVGLKLIPPYMEEAEIRNIFTAIAHDPELQSANPLEIQMAFNRRSSIDNITSIKSSDIEVSSEGGALYVSASYEVRIPLFANVSFLLEFNPGSE